MNLTDNVIKSIDWQSQVFKKFRWVPPQCTKQVVVLSKLIPFFETWMNTHTITLVNKDFVPWGKMSVSDVVLDAEFKYVFIISLSPTPFAPGQSAEIFCAMTIMCVFTVSAMRNSKISSPWKMVSCFAMMFVPLWKFLAMNITQISGACSLIRQKWAWGGSNPQWK